MVRLLAAGGAAGLGTVVGELTAHGYSGYVVIAVVGLLGLSVAGSAVLRLCETRAKRSPAQVKAAAVTRAARRVADPERALRLLLGTPADQSGDGGQTTADAAACPAIQSENRQPPKNVPSSDL
jgi:hypothetical protein